MIVWALILIPTLAGVAAFFIRPDGLRRALLVAAAAVHLGLTAMCWTRPEGLAVNAWLAMDAASLLFLTCTSVLFFAASIYGIGYLRHEAGHRETDVEEGFLFDNLREATFTACLLLFLAAQTLVTVSAHLGLIWVAMEATTLASAPLIYFHRHHRSLEATWKYLLICSVGIALALMGNFCMAVAASFGEGEPIRLTIQALTENAGRLAPVWLKAAFIMALIGYGTKMGLAPLHTWLPDAHSEAPSIVSALLSGALLNCAFLAILRMVTVLNAAGMGTFTADLLILFGLLSMAVAALFMIAQTDFKRMLAYSSVEHMGILSLGVGLGGLAGFGAMLHAMNHSMAKGLLFLAAGNLLAVYKTKRIDQVHGAIRIAPITAGLWLAGFLAITGSPPFGPFVSELTILRGGLYGGHLVAMALYLVFLGVVFVAMARVSLNMVYGPAPEGMSLKAHEPWWSVCAPGLLGLPVLVLGLYVPKGLQTLLEHAVQGVGVQ
jgi:hydrogenase-4 component F